MSIKEKIKALRGKLKISALIAGLSLSPSSNAQTNTQPDDNFGNKIELSGNKNTLALSNGKSFNPNEMVSMGNGNQIKISDVYETLNELSQDPDEISKFMEENQLNQLSNFNVTKLSSDDYGKLQPGSISKLFAELSIKNKTNPYGTRCLHGVKSIFRELIRELDKQGISTDEYKEFYAQIANLRHAYQLAPYLTKSPLFKTFTISHSHYKDQPIGSIAVLTKGTTPHGHTYVRNKYGEGCGKIYNIRKDNHYGNGSKHYGKAIFAVLGDFTVKPEFIRKYYQNLDNDQLFISILDNPKALKNLYDWGNYSKLNVQPAKINNIKSQDYYRFNIPHPGRG